MTNISKTLGAVVLIIIIMIAGYYLYDTFHEKNSSEKIAEIIHLEDQRVISSDLKAYLSDENVSVRARAALAVGRIGGKESAELLYPMITGDVIDVAEQAAFAIGLTGEHAYADNLLDIAFDAPSKVGAQAVASAGRLADSTTKEAYNLLTGYLTHPSPEVRKEAAMAIFRANGKETSDALIDVMYEEKDEEVQAAALFALARLNNKKGYPLYVDFLADADPFVRSLAVRGMALNESAEAEQYLSIALNDGNKQVVAEAIRGLAKRKTSIAKTNVLKKFRREEDEKLLGELISGMIRQENFNAEADIQNMLNDSTTPINVVAEGIIYLAHAMADRSVIIIDSLMRHVDSRVRVACAEAFSVLKTPNNIPRLAVLFRDPVESVRAAAFSELVAMDSANIGFYLDQALADTSVMLPVLAIEQIKTHHLKEYLSRLYQMSIDQMTQPLSMDIRRSLVDGASAFISKDSRDSMAMRIIVNGMLDESYVVRKETAEIYRTVLDENRDSMIKTAPTRITTYALRSAFADYPVNPIAILETTKGRISFELLFDIAPLTVLNYIGLAESGYYDGTIFHRVIPDFVAQGGDPTGNGWGGPGYSIRCEYSEVPYVRGTVGMATSGKDTGGSQFFITHSPQPHLDGRYTVFGQVIEGMDVVDQLVIGDKIISVTIEEGKSI